MIEDDIDAALADAKVFGAAVSVVHGANTVNGFRDQGPGVMTDESGLSIELEPESVLIRAGALSPAPLPNDAITVDGVSYRVRESRPEPRDGEMTRIVLVRQT